jgi:hypothetical protein
VHDLVAVLGHDRVLQLTGGDHVELVGRVSDVMQELPAARAPRRRRPTEGLDLRGREVLEQIGPEEQRDAIGRR